MKKATKAKFKKFVGHPGVRLAMAIILILSGLCEIFETYVKDLLGFKIGIHHGAIIFGTFQALAAFVEVTDSVKEVIEAKEEKEAR
ncbi:MAG: hypothetical protein GY757_41525 [bacterium]|nr:hypothetical protein [bacterium]